MRLRIPPETVGNRYHGEQKGQLHRDDSSQSMKVQVERYRSDDIRRKQLTGIRTVLMPRSEIHAQSSSIIHVSQCLSRTCLAFMPRATSRSLCAGWKACWKGLSAIQRSRTNQEPDKTRWLGWVVERRGEGRKETYQD